MIKALFFDIDDTLIKRGKFEVEASAYEAICKAREKGLKIIISTGRAYSLMHEDIKDRVKADYYITSNGACINDTEGNAIASYPMKKETTEKIIEAFVEKDYPFAFKFVNSFRVYNRFKDFTDKYCNKAISIKNVYDDSAKRDYHLTHNEMPLDCFVFSENFEAVKVFEQFDDIQYYSNKKEGSECWSNQANKGKSIIRLVEELGLTLDECMSFGDGTNDIEMIENCGIGVAMGNAQDELKQVADYITTDIDKDGIYNALKHFEII